MNDGQLVKAGTFLSGVIIRIEPPTSIGTM
jgi:hypothetical protein